MQEYVYMPNEIFEDLCSNIESSSQRAFAYCYLYYTTYLYRYCKYQADKKNTQADIKQFLGYNPSNKKLDYIIKKDGVIDKMGYTLTTTDYPVLWIVNSDNVLEFTNISEVKDKTISSIIPEKNFKVKYPIKCFYRTDEDEKAQLLTGTFYDTSNTHKITFNTFNEMINNKDIGVMGVYIYAYINYKNGMFPEYQSSYEKLSLELDISKTTLSKYINALEEAGLLHVNHQKFKLGEVGEANSYKTKTTKKKKPIK